MFHNMSMLDGFAFCADDEEYEHTYLDQIKIKDSNYDTRPVYIDKLFENEDLFLDEQNPTDLQNEDMELVQDEDNEAS